MKITKFITIAIILCLFSIQALYSNPTIILFGLPGAGKGTLSQNLIEKYQYAHICPGNLLRAEVRNQSNFGKEIETILTKGDLVPEQVTFAFLKNSIMETHHKNLPIIFDGYPRSVEALGLLDSLLEDLALKENTIILNLHIEKEKLLERVLNRAVCNKCNKVYTKEQTDCNTCQTKLEKRPQDTVEILEKRIGHYMQVSKPVLQSFIDHGYQVHEIEVDPDPADIFNHVCRLIDSHPSRANQKQMLKNNVFIDPEKLERIF